MIVSNRVLCLKCHELIFSASVHDYKRCTCGAVAVDGGQEYLRRVFQERADFKDLSICLPKKVVEECEKAVDWGLETNRNSLGIALAVIRALSDAGHLNPGKLYSND